jgi:hypothetical protein
MRSQIFALAPIALTISLLGAGCGQPAQPGVENEQKNQATTTQQVTTSTLPEVSVTSTQGTITNEDATSTVSKEALDFAEKTCDDALGSLININAPTGRWQACYFKDDSLCEIGSLERGECRAGVCKEVCLHKGTASEGWYDYCSGLLVRLAKCVAK